MLAELLCAPALAAVLALCPDRGLAHAPAPPADVNDDGVIDYDDVIDHLFLWGRCEDDACTGDLDRDGFVDVLDFIELLGSLDRVLMADARSM